MMKFLFSNIKTFILVYLLSLVLVFSASAKVCFLPNLEDCDNVGASASQAATEQCADYINNSEYFVTDSNLNHADCPCHSGGTYYCKCEQRYSFDGSACVETCPSNIYNLSEPKGGLWECTPCNDGVSTRYGMCVCNYTETQDGQCVTDGQCSGDEYKYSEDEKNEKTNLGYNCSPCSDTTSQNNGLYKCTCDSPKGLNDETPQYCAACSSNNTPRQYFTKPACDSAKNDDEKCEKDAHHCWMRVQIACDAPKTVVDGECKCPANKPFSSLQECRNDLVAKYGTQANAFSWRNTLYEVAQCLLPIKPAYAQQLSTDDPGEYYPMEQDPTCEQCKTWFECNDDQSYTLYSGGSWSGGTESFSQKIITRSKCNQICGYEIPSRLRCEVIDDEEYEPEPEEETQDGARSAPEYECVTDENVCWYQREKVVEPAPEPERQWLYVQVLGFNQINIEITSGATEVSCPDCRHSVTDSITNQTVDYYQNRRYKIKKGSTVTVKSTACKGGVPESWMGTIDFDSNGTDTLTFTLDENLASRFSDQYWGTENTPAESFASLEPDYADLNWDYFSTQGGCIDLVSACTYDSTSQCYVKNNTPARIYCSYDDMLKTGSSCWEGTSWFEHPCEGELHSPCEVDYQVTANNGSQGVTVCPGAQEAKNKPNNSSGPIEIPAGTYDLNVSYVGAIDYTSESTQSGIPGVNISLGNFKYWVPDVMLVMDNVSANSFKCYNIMYNGANNKTCTIYDKVKVQDELYNSGLYNKVFYDQGMDSMKDCNIYENDKKYHFEAGKTYYIHVGSSASHTSDQYCTSAWGCGYKTD